MKNFLRGLRWTWPYRGRLALSVVFALLAAVLWGLNLTVIYPVLKLLEDKDKESWTDQVEAEMTRLQGNYESESKTLERHRFRLRGLDLPEGKERDKQERELAGAIAKIEGRLSTLSRSIYLYQLLKQFIVRYVPADRFWSLAWLFAASSLRVALKGLFEFLQESLVGSVVNRTAVRPAQPLLPQRHPPRRQPVQRPGHHELMARFTNDMELLGAGMKTLFGQVVAEPLRAVGLHRRRLLDQLAADAHVPRPGAGRPRRPDQGRPD